jgi:hypothetical protein
MVPTELARRELGSHTKGTVEYRVRRRFGDHAIRFILMIGGQLVGDVVALVIVRARRDDEPRSCRVAVT